MARKVWVLDTETKGTGAEMVPLEKVLRKPTSGEPLSVHVPPEPKPPRSFRIVDVTTGDVLGEHLDTRATIAALEDVGSVVDVRIYVWDHGTKRWVLLTLGEQKTLWEFRGRREPA
jgi:hypothetical protein